MLIVLTDVLTCPRCGPEFGLIVMAERLEQRRVIEGLLSCANCREMFPIRAGLADLRYPPGPSLEAVGAAAKVVGNESDLAFRLAALLGVRSGPGWVVVVGPQAAVAPEIALLVPELGVVAIGPEVVRLPDRERTNRVVTEHRLPLRSGSMRGVALTGVAVENLFEEGLRLLAPGARIVLDPAPEGVAERLERAGLQVLLSQNHIMVASGVAHR